MNLKILLSGLNWFQGKLVAFVEKSQQKNEAALEKIAGIEAKVQKRQAEIKTASKISKSIDKLFEDDDDEDLEDQI